MYELFNHIVLKKVRYKRNIKYNPYKYPMSDCEINKTGFWIGNCKVKDNKAKKKKNKDLLSRRAYCLALKQWKLIFIIFTQQRAGIKLVDIDIDIGSVRVQKILLNYKVPRYLFTYLLGKKVATGTRTKFSAKLIDLCRIILLLYPHEYQVLLIIL
jgi:hypothetical protein